MAPDAHPSNAPIPRVGKIFIFSSLLGVGLLTLGFATRNMLFVYVGAAIIGLVLLAALLGEHVA